MRPDNESHLALYPFTHELNGSSFVQFVHRLMLASEMHVWVVLRQQTREAQYAV